MTAAALAVMRLFPVSFFFLCFYICFRRKCFAQAKHTVERSSTLIADCHDPSRSPQILSSNVFSCCWRGISVAKGRGHHARGCRAMPPRLSPGKLGPQVRFSGARCPCSAIPACPALVTPPNSRQIAGEGLVPRARGRVGPQLLAGRPGSSGLLLKWRIGTIG